MRGQAERGGSEKLLNILEGTAGVGSLGFIEVGFDALHKALCLLFHIHDGRVRLVVRLMETGAVRWSVLTGGH